MIILAGASASGKTEVAKELAKKYGITKMITTTTRAMRNGEVNGKDYFFVTKEQFKKMIDESKFVEHTLYNDNFYGSTKDQIGPNKCVVIDPVGLKSYLALGNPDIITFFLDASEETRYQRMLLRGDPVEKAKNRVINDRDAFKPEHVEPADFYIDTEKYNVEEVTDLVYKLYTDEINKRRNKK